MNRREVTIVPPRKGPCRGRDSRQTSPAGPGGVQTARVPTGRRGEAAPPFRNELRRSAGEVDDGGCFTAARPGSMIRSTFSRRARISVGVGERMLLVGQQQRRTEDRSPSRPAAPTPPDDPGCSRPMVLRLGCSTGASPLVPSGIRCRPRREWPSASGTGLLSTRAKVAMSDRSRQISVDKWRSSTAANAAGCGQQRVIAGVTAQGVKRNRWKGGEAAATHDLGGLF